MCVCVQFQRRFLKCGKVKQLPKVTHPEFICRHSDASVLSLSTFPFPAFRLILSLMAQNSHELSLQRNPAESPCVGTCVARKNHGGGIYTMKQTPGPTIPTRWKRPEKGDPERGGATAGRSSHYFTPWLSSLCLVIWDQSSSWEQIVKERDKTKER